MKKLFFLTEENFNTLGAVRGIKGLLCATNEKGIWLMLKDDHTADHAILQQLPVQHSYLINEEGLLFNPGGLTPVDKLVIDHWLAIDNFIPVEIPIAALPGEIKASLPVRLKRSDSMKISTALLTSLTNWKRFAENAPAVRLSKLRFSASSNEQVFIVGNPLPAIPGQEYWIQNDIFIPCGYSLEWPILASTIKKQFPESVCLVATTTSEFQVIPYSQFVTATRSSIRLTSLSS